MARPFISFVLPVLNAELFLPACLSSIRAQDYPRDRYEILVAEGGSTDGTRRIAEQHDCVIVEADGLLAEAGKQLAFQCAQGDYIAMLDADNEIAATDWLSQAVDALARYPDTLGFESYYLKHASHTHLNRYLTALLLISDPIARSLAGRLRLLRRDHDGVELYELPADGSYPTGANGFLFRSELLEQLKDMPSYHEAAFFPSLIRQGYRQLVKRQGCGVYHHYVSGWGDYLRKRRRAMMVYMLRKEEFSGTWDGAGVGPRKLLTVLYHATLIGPAIEGVVRALATGDADWLLHPIASLVSTIGNTWAVLQYRSLNSSEKRVRTAVQLHRHHKGKTDKEK